jgi:hypothetical protein
MKYINIITRITRVHFGSRVRVWNDGVVESGYYNWHNVYELTKFMSKFVIPSTFLDFLYSRRRKACGEYGQNNTIFIIATGGQQPNLLTSLDNVTWYSEPIRRLQCDRGVSVKILSITLVEVPAQ